MGSWSTAMIATSTAYERRDHISSAGAVGAAAPRVASGDAGGCFCCVLCAVCLVSAASARSTRCCASGRLRGRFRGGRGLGMAASVLVHPQHGHEGLLRNLDVAHALHALLSLSLLLEQLPFARHVSAVALRDDVLPHG